MPALPARHPSAPAPRPLPGPHPDPHPPRHRHPVPLAVVDGVFRDDGGLTTAQLVAVGVAWAQCWGHPWVARGTLGWHRAPLGGRGHPGVTPGPPAHLNTRCPSFKPRPMKSLALPPSPGSCGRSGAVSGTGGHPDPPPRGGRGGLSTLIPSPAVSPRPAHRPMPQQQPLGAARPQLQLHGLRRLGGAARKRGGRLGGCSTPGWVRHPRERCSTPGKGGTP